MTLLQLNGSSTFRIRRSVTTSEGLTSQVEPLVAKYLVELDALLGKRVLPPRHRVGTEDEDTQLDVAQQRQDSPRQFLVSLLDTPLAPKKAARAHSKPLGWAEGSLAATLHFADEKPGNLTLSDFLDQDSRLAELKYAFIDMLETAWPMLPFDVRAVTKDYPNILDYIIAYAVLIRGIDDANALRHFLTKNTAGARRIADYAVVSAAREVIEQQQLTVEHHNADDSDFVAGLVRAAVPLSSLGCRTGIDDYINAFVFHRRDERLIQAADMGPLTPELKAQLLRFIQHSPIEITPANAKMFLPSALMQFARLPSLTSAEDGLQSGTSDSDFQVQFQDDADSGAIAISRSAVLCASQFFFGMVIGDELDVFGAVDYLIRKRLVGRGAHFDSPVLRQDLTMYVFNNKFYDLRSKLWCDRTRPAERRMFQRQVFNQSHAPVPDDLPVNPEFGRLWKVLMLESARYLEKAQASLNPDSFVSRQNVMQAVEDLQYNLSGSCVGMATIISPLADAELNFVLERILKQKEIIAQILPEGGNWKQAVDRLNAECNKQVGPATTLFNKGALGQGIIQGVADYTTTAFEDDGIFSGFISKVDGFITTQSILSRRKTLPDHKHGEEEDGHEYEPPSDPPWKPPANAAPPNGTANGTVSAPANGAAAGDWDF